MKSPAVQAAVFALGTAAFVALSSLAAKIAQSEWLGPPLHVFQVAHARFLFAALGLALAAVVLRPTFGEVHWRWHFARTSCGFVGVTLLFASVVFIPLADATAIAFLNPVFAMLFAAPLLRERIGPWRTAAAVIGLTGALVLARPSPEAFQPAALLALAAAMAFGMEAIFVKRLSGREAPFQILTVNNAIGVCLASVALIPFAVMPTGGQWLALAGVGFAMVLAQACFIQAMRRADATYVVPFSYATLIFAAVLDAMVFAALPDGVTVLGAAVILTGAGLLVWREGRRKEVARDITH